MKINITRANEHVLFKVENASAATAFVDGSPDIGGVNGGLRPMEMVLAALATCSAFEIVNILKKQRQPLEDLAINVNGERKKGDTNQPFSRIDVEFIVKGAVDQSKADRAAKLAIEKYCSVKSSLDPAIDVQYQLKIESMS